MVLYVVKSKQYANHQSHEMCALCSKAVRFGRSEVRNLSYLFTFIKWIYEDKLKKFMALKSITS